VFETYITNNVVDISTGTETVQKLKFSRPALARYVKFIVVEFEGHASLRAGLITIKKEEEE